MFRWHSLGRMEDGVNTVFGETAMKLNRENAEALFAEGGFAAELGGRWKHR